ncbi:ribosomal RNA small subunit methyltransferase I [Oxobacter pfennigii]|uniref:Ribosomal RNA small subunit methyltransferase I n=1 Tax=Oxobacter pfennigii TaxID=36849 RepID=A0A0P8WXJ4_9CLOT|nr:16S rRNA (cytidine(1402)-2'-O)-methyltransferase [Oxobacter pfennigii]KPU43067.1 ribosomal RNA small subunit methyltransferase I [Oxobacter pfennigii]
MGKLYLCGTPIGNLEDLTLRVIRVLKEVDIIAAEDTRQSIKLLNHIETKKTMISYHEHNKKEMGPLLIQKLKEGLNIALVTDAGMPGISDPGEDLVRLCIHEGIEVEAIPGPTALITALVLSGFSTGKFIFEGFLPRENKGRKEVLETLKDEIRTVIIYEAPHRIKNTLKDLLECLGNRKVAICRELTKKFEEILRVSLKEALQVYDNKEPRGEYVIIIEGKDKKELIEEQQRHWQSMSIEEHIDIYIKKGFNKKDALKMAAKDRGISKRELYKYTIE